MENNYGLIKAFGPSIFKAKIPEELLNKLNKFIDDTINDEEQSKKLDVGKGLVGDVKQEFKLDKKTVQESGWLKFLVHLFTRLKFQKNFYLSYNGFIKILEIKFQRFKQELIRQKNCG